jgi:hypothetical protein
MSKADARPHLLPRNIFLPHSRATRASSCLVTEGCLISIFRHEAGSGGRGMTARLEMRRAGPAVQAADVPARPPRGPRAVVRHPSVMKGARNGSPPGALRSKPQTPRAGRLGTGGLAAITDFDKPRCREALRPVGPSTLSLRTLRKLECARTRSVPRALGSFSGGRRVCVPDTGQARHPHHDAGYRASPASPS